MNIEIDRDTYLAGKLAEIKHLTEMKDQHFLQAVENGAKANEYRREVERLLVELANLIAERDNALRLLRECKLTLEMWSDVAPAVTLRADIQKMLRMN